MNWVDIAILVVWGITVFWGYSTGLMGVLVPFICLVLGLVAYLPKTALKQAGIPIKRVS